MRKNSVRDFFAHATIILSAMFIIFLIIDSYNPMMEFISSSISKKLLFIFCVFSMTTSIWTAKFTFKRRKRLLAEERQRANERENNSYR